MSDVKAVLVKHFINAVDGVFEDSLDTSASMKDTYGASSLDVVSVVSGTMRELKIKVPRTELKNVASLDDLVALFERSA